MYFIKHEFSVALILFEVSTYLSVYRILGNTQQTGLGLPILKEGRRRVNISHIDYNLFFRVLT